MLPHSVQKNIQSLLEEVGSKPSLVSARQQLTKRYRTVGQKNTSGFSTPHEVIAYLAARMPATFAAVESVLPHVPFDNVNSVLDLGAGPGTAALAAALRWPLCKQFHLVEGDTYMSEVSQKALYDLPEITTQTFSFEQSNLLNFTINEPYDVVILSYVLNELSPKNQQDILKKTWEKTTKGLVIVVPGTPCEYQQLMVLRDLMITLGAFIAAPCPHHNACPLVQGDWCHFTTRLPRSSHHKEIKGVSLPYEDEKFSYLVFLREPHSQVEERIIRKPLKRSGHVILDLCTKEGLKRQTVSKRDKSIYKAATHVAWGESWNRDL